MNIQCKRFPLPKFTFPFQFKTTHKISLKTWLVSKVQFVDHPLPKHVHTSDEHLFNLKMIFIQFEPWYTKNMSKYEIVIIEGA
jgi:hypothetical protein